MNTLQLTQSGVKLNGFIFDINRLDPLERSIHPLRTVELRQDISLNIIDDLGIRFWTNRGKTIQVQIVLGKQFEESDDPKMPIHAYDGLIILLGQTLVLPIALTSFVSDSNVKLVRDLDGLQYKLNMYHAYLGSMEYTLWVDREDAFITSIYFRVQASDYS